MEINTEYWEQFRPVCKTYLGLLTLANIVIFMIGLVLNIIVLALIK